MPPSDLEYGEALCTLMHTPVPTGIQGTALSECRLQSKVPLAQLSHAGASVPVFWLLHPPVPPLPDLAGREGCIPFTRLPRQMLSPSLS